MKTQHKHNLYIFSILAILIAVVLLQRRCNHEPNQPTEKELAYKREIIEKDSLRKEDSITYARLVNDMYKERELMEQLEMENQYLYDKLKAEERKVTSLTKVVGKLKSKKSVIPLSKTNGYTYFEDYYPKKENYFVRYKAQIEENSVISEFDFQPLRLDLVVTEKQKGIYEVYLNAPSWLEITSVEVKSLPIQSPSLRPDNFDWMFGGAFGYSYLYRQPIVGLSGGFRYKRFVYYLQGNSNQTLYFGVNKFF